MSVFKTSLLLLLWGLLGACQSPPEKGDEGGRPFDIRSLAKSDVDQVTELQLQFAMETLEGLTHKLYMRNPKEWRKAGLDDPEAAVARVFGPGRTGIYPELRGLRTVNAIRLAFEPGYQGDRVLAFAEGVRSMLVAAHNGKQRFYYTDELDPQKLYNAARNIEVAVWMLKSRRDADGALYLLTNETGGAVPNLSFERQFGQLIGLQDSTARIISASTNRRVKNVIMSVASMVFLPI